MIALKLEQRGPDVVAVFDDETRAALKLEVGDVIHIERTPHGVTASAELDIDHEVRAGRGRAFLKRYNRTFQALET